MGGAGKSGQWYENILDTKWRDIGCSALIILDVIILFGWYSNLWWVYLLIFALHWASFTTYWDWMFGGEDNLGFSGFVVGACFAPILFMCLGLWWIVLLRAVALGIIWDLLNKKLPQKVWIWDRAVAEEFLRYAVAV